MRTFREFVEQQDLKTLISTILDPEGDAVDEDSSDFMSVKIGSFKTKKDLLKNPELTDIINQHDNRGAIISAINNDDTTVGTLLSLLGDEKIKSKDFLG